MRKLPAVVLALADDPRDLVEAVAEDVVEQEDRALDRRERLEQYEERHRERVRLLDEDGGIIGIVGHDRLRKPLADVLLVPRERRPELVNAEAGHDRRQERLRRLDLPVLGARACEADARLLSGVRPARVALGDEAPGSRRRGRRQEVLGSFRSQLVRDRELVIEATQVLDPGERAHLVDERVGLRSRDRLADRGGVEAVDDDGLRTGRAQRVQLLPASRRRFYVSDSKTRLRLRV
jgi:hypothetical protein